MTSTPEVIDPGKWPMKEGRMNGYLSLRGHLIELNEWLQMGGAASDYVAWCHSCDPHGGAVMRIDVERRTDLGNAFVELMTLVKEHYEGLG